MPKFNPSAAKLLAVEKYFIDHRPITAHSIKDLEKALPLASGISGMQVKDYLTALTDENKIRVEKIGSGNWYWCFRDDEQRLKQKELKQWKSEITGLEAKLKALKGEVDKERHEKEGDGEGKAVRAMAIEDIQTLSKEKSDLENALTLYADNDPAQLDFLTELFILMKSAANMHTENICAIEGYLKRAGMPSEDIKAFKENHTIPGELDDVE